MALLDYIAVESAEPQLLRDLAVGLAVGAEAAGVEIPGGEVCQVPEVLQGHPSPYGFDLVGSAFGTINLHKIITGKRAGSRRRADRPARLRRALQRSHPGPPGTAGPTAGSPWRPPRPELGGQSVADVLLEPTVIYVKAIMALIRAEIDGARARPTSPAAVCSTCCDSDPGSASPSPTPLAVPPVFDLIARLGGVPPAEMWEVFNMGCGFVAMVPADAAESATELLAEYHPGTARIGTVTDNAGVVEIPALGVPQRSGCRQVDRPPLAVRVTPGFLRQMPARTSQLGPVDPLTGSAVSALPGVNR